MDTVDALFGEKKDKNTESPKPVTPKEFLDKYGDCHVALRDDDMHPEYVTIRQIFEGFAAAMEPKPAAKKAVTAKKPSKSKK